MTGSGTTERVACRFREATARVPGAVGVIELVGDVEVVLKSIAGDRRDWPVGVVRLARMGDIDDAVVMRPGEESALIMPHGGVRIMQALRDYLIELGLGPLGDDDVLAAHPEADDLIEALMLEALGKAPSALAIDLLLAQPARWRRWAKERDENIESIRARSVKLNRLLYPPKVVVVGAPNSGKSTLMNTLAGRDAAITADVQGTTRDFIGAVIDLAGLTVWWYDTPGIHATEDAIEAEAIAIAHRLIDAADYVVLVAEPGGDWPVVGRAADVRVMLKSDLVDGGASVPEIQRAMGADLAVSAVDGVEVGALVELVRGGLVGRGVLENEGCWLFDDRVVGAVL